MVSGNTVETSTGSTFPPLPNKKFEIIYCDPPWDYAGQPQHSGTKCYDTSSAKRYYPTVPLPILKTLDVGQIAAEDCLLFMWATSPHLDQAIDLGKSWDFEWATVAFVWNKQKLNPGFYTMSQCELCLVFKRGNIPQPRGARNIHQLISEERTEHSSKPDEARWRIERMFPSQSKIELFARLVPPSQPQPKHSSLALFDSPQPQPPTGWMLWGFEAGNDIGTYVSC